MPRVCRLLPVAAVFLLPACGGSDIPMQKTVAVTGTVLLDGQPAAGIDVRFIPVDKTNFKLDETPLGRTDEAGKFTLTTYHSNDGAPVGEYKVVVAYPDQPVQAAEDDETAALIKAGAAKGKRTPPKRLPAIYQNPDKSGLKAKVEKSGELPPIELSSKAK